MPCPMERSHGGQAGCHQASGLVAEAGGDYQYSSASTGFAAWLTD
jgi:hypothetical protein